MLFVPCFTAVFMVYNLPKAVPNGKDFFVFRQKALDYRAFNGYNS